MLRALGREFDDGASWSRPEGGYFVWLDLPREAPVAELLPRAAAAGVTFVPGTDFFPAGAGGTSSARLAFSFVSLDEIDEGISRLAELLRDGGAVGTAASSAGQRAGRSQG
jgi:DNA-binding transcriptional MocR family regulator